ncbi:MAG: hypothetical protein JRI83_11660 [Deltaproteobacteria bacterium]|nr:hypothetical protein [Deltaproteobacteria bacterium]MBW2131225.1 hypothetical protein [Deltaproteobacteria bacterium]
MQKPIPNAVRDLFLFLIAFLGFFATPVFAQHPFDLIEKTQRGKINWSRFTVQATGTGTLTQKQNENASALTLSAAKDAARKNILSTLEHLRLAHHRTVFQILEKNRRITEEIEKILQNARVIAQEYLSDKTARVVMELSLLGAFSQLILPAELKQIESVKPIVPPEETPAPFTGLIVDAAGIPMKPALVPKIVDESGKEVFGSAFASRDSAVQQGMCRWVVDVAAARQVPRVGTRPLVVKGLKIRDGEETTIVISTADAARLKSASEHLQLLRKCAVAIAIGPGMH